MNEFQKNMLNTYGTFNDDTGKWEFYPDDIGEMFEDIREEYWEKLCRERLNQKKH